MEQRRKLSTGWLSLIIILAVIILDQVLKIWVKTQFYLGEHIDILPFFELRFIENPGMAFGMKLGSKLFLTVFRILVVALLAVYLWRLRNSQKVPRGYIVCVALIVAGAVGNIFDCVAYGQIFTESTLTKAAEMVPWGSGYERLFHGRVVDMLYFPLFSFEWPSWVPWLGGSTFSFFDPVFNLADASISIGIIVMLLFYRKYVMVMNDAEAEKIKEESEQKKAEKEAAKSESD